MAPKTGFLDLPTELRHMVYMELFFEPGIFDRPDRYFKPITFRRGKVFFRLPWMGSTGRTLVFNLVCTCKTMSEEVAQVFYSRSHHQFWDFNHAMMWFRIIGSRNAALIQSVEVDRISLMGCWAGRDEYNVFKNLLEFLPKLRNLTMWTGVRRLKKSGKPSEMFDIRRIKMVMETAPLLKHGKIFIQPFGRFGRFGEIRITADQRMHRKKRGEIEIRIEWEEDKTSIKEWHFVAERIEDSVTKKKL